MTTADDGDPDATRPKVTGLEGADEVRPGTAVAKVTGLEGAGEVRPTKVADLRRLPMSELEWSGVRLAYAMLGLVIAVCVLVVLATYRTEFSSSPAPEIATGQRLLEQASQQYLATSSSETLERANQLLKTVNEGRTAARKVWSDLGQQLLNLLLPILMAILGYIFGSARPRAQDPDK